MSLYQFYVVVTLTNFTKEQIGFIVLKTLLQLQWKQGKCICRRFLHLICHISLSIRLDENIKTSQNSVGVPQVKQLHVMTTAVIEREIWNCIHL